MVLQSITSHNKLIVTLQFILSILHTKNKFYPFNILLAPISYVPPISFSNTRLVVVVVVVVVVAVVVVIIIIIIITKVEQ
jgi:hypothetical protein